MRGDGFAEDPHEEAVAQSNENDHGGGRHQGKEEGGGSFPDAGITGGVGVVIVMVMDIVDGSGFRFAGRLAIRPLGDSLGKVSALENPEKQDRVDQA